MKMFLDLSDYGKGGMINKNFISFMAPLDGWGLFVLKLSNGEEITFDLEHWDKMEAELKNAIKEGGDK